MKPDRMTQGLNDALLRLEKEEADLQARLGKTQQMIAGIRDVIGHLAPDDVAGEGEATHLAMRERAQPKEVRNEMFAILREREEPMHSVALLDELTNRGFVILGKDPANNVRAYLSSDERFEPIGKGLWDIRSRRSRLNNVLRVAGGVAAAVAYAGANEEQRSMMETPFIQSAGQQRPTLIGVSPRSANAEPEDEKIAL